MDGAPQKATAGPDQVQAKAAKVGRVHLGLGTPHTARGALPPRYQGPIRDFIERLDHGEALLAKLGLTARNPKSTDEDGPEIIREGIMVAPCPGATRVVVAVGGNTKPYPYHNELAALPDTHIVLLRDRSRCFSLLGVHRMGLTFEESLASMGELFSALGVQHSFFIGVSSGGFAALKMALELRADGVMGFGSPTSLRIEDDPSATMETYPQLALLYRRARHLGTDMVVEYGEAHPHPSVVLVYGGEHERDRFFAGRMKDVPGVTLDALEGLAEHSVYEELAQRGVLAGYLDRLLALRAVA